MTPHGAALHRAKAATVGLPERGGRGILVPGGLVLTAMHCIGWDRSAGLVLGDHHPVAVEAGGKRFRLGPLFADAVSDMAVLGPLDNQIFPDDEEAFDDWRSGTKSVPLSEWTPEPRTLARPDPPPLRVHLLSLGGEWFEGEARYWGTRAHPAYVAVTSQRPIEAGTSGGPIVDGRGRLVGIVSTSVGQTPLVRATLPSAVVAQILGDLSRTGTERAQSPPAAKQPRPVSR